MLTENNMGDLEREMLLGYLMNALEDDEIAYVERELLRQPQLRTELAALQKELSPLTYVYESVDPPPLLAKRTCNRIWAQVDRKKSLQENISSNIPESSAIISMTIRDTDHEVPKTFSEQSPVFSAKPASALDEVLTSSPQIVTPSVSSEKMNLSPEIFVSDTSNQKRLVRRSPHSNSLTEVRDIRQTNTTINNNAYNTNHIPNTSNNVNFSESSALNLPKTKEPRNRIDSRLPIITFPVTPIIQKLLSKRTWWSDMTVSVTAGILIAVIIFPTISFFLNRIQSSFVKNAKQEINQRVDIYAQLQGIGNDKTNSTGLPDLTSPVNLAQSGWQELNPAQFPALILGSTANQSFDAAPIESYPAGLLKSVSTQGESITPIRSRSRDIVLGQIKPDMNTENVTDFFPLDPREFNDRTLISNVDYVIPITGGGSMLQTAYGQNVLFQNGRIYIRVLPVFTPNQQK